MSELVPVVTELGLPESPRWHDGRVWFCDWLDGSVLSVDPDGDDLMVHATVDGFPICIDWDLDGNLLVVDGAGRRVLRGDSTNRRVLRGDTGGLQLLTDLASLADGPWNEIVTHPSGRIYVNGPGYDLMAGQDPASGQIAVIDVDGTARLVADGLAFPNGMALVDGGARLLVAESHGARITRYIVAENGDLIGRAALTAIPNSAPDGLCVSDERSIWYADVPNRCCRRISSYGRFLTTVNVDRGCFSCVESPDGDLYITAAVWDDQTFTSRRGVLYRVIA